MFIKSKLIQNISKELDFNVCMVGAIMLSVEIHCKPTLAILSLETTGVVNLLDTGVGLA